MKINKNLMIPLYVQVENQIRDKIKNNTWSKGTKIPSESTLVKTLGVSRGTIKKALNNLTKEGLLIQKQGLGTFVIGEDYSVPVTEGLHSFYEYMKSRGINFTTEVINKSIIEAPKSISEKMEIENDQKILFLERTRTVDGEVVMRIKNYINISLAPNIIDENFLDDGLFNLIEKHTNHKVSFSETRFSAIGADKINSEIFSIEDGAPLLFHEQIVHLDNNEIIELGKVWLKSNRFYIGLSMKRTY